MPSTPTARRSLLILLFGAAILVAVVVLPLAGALFLAAVLAALLWPLQQRCAAFFNGSRGPAAGLVVCATVILLVVPLTALSMVVVKQGAESMAFVSRTFERSGVEGLLRRLPPPIGRVIIDGLRRLPNEQEGALDASVQRQLNANNAVAIVGSAISATGSMVFQAAMMLVALYFLLCQGDQLVAWIDRNAPLKKGQALELLVEVQRVSSAVVTSTMVTAAAQAGAALVGYLLAGVPRPIFAASMTFLLAFIPAIGAGAACLAVAALVALAGHLYAALFLAIWGVVVVGLTDNVVRPFLIHSGAGLHGAVVFFALIGGLEAFGAIGLLVGPLAVALFLAILRIHGREAGLDHAPLMLRKGALSRQ